MGKDCAHGSGIELLTDNDAGGAAACKIFVAVIVLLAAGKGHDLGGNVCAELLLAGAALDDNIGSHLAVLKAHELQGNYVRALMEKLIEGVLTVGAGLTEDDGAGHVVHRLAEAVDGLAVGLHVQLLEVGGEAAHCLRVGQHGSGGIAEDVTLVDADEGIQHCSIALYIGVLCKFIRLGCACKKLGKHLRAESKGQNCAAHSGGGRVAAADIVVHEKGCKITGVLCQRRVLAGDCQHMLCRVETGFFQRVLHEGLVGQSLKRGAGLGHQHEKGVGHVYLAEDTGCIVRVNIAYKLSLHLQSAVDLCPVFKGKVDGAGTKIAAADAYLHHGGEFFACGIGDLTGVDLLCKLSYFLLLLGIKYPLIHAVGNDCPAQLRAGQMVQNAALLAGVDDLAVIECCKLFGKLGLICKLGKGGQNFIVYRSCAVIEVKPFGHFHAVISHALCALLSAHLSGKVNGLEGLKLLVCFQHIHVFPVYHRFGLLIISNFPFYINFCIILPKNQNNKPLNTSIMEGFDPLHVIRIAFSCCS